MKHLDSIKRLAETSIDVEDKSILGFHGTSIEAIRYLAEHGKMPVTGCYDIEFHIADASGVNYDTGPYGEAKKYAEIHVFRNQLIRDLNKLTKLTRERLRDVMIFCEDDWYPFDYDFWQFLKESLKMSEYEFMKYIKKLRRNNNHKGVVLAIRNSISELKPYAGCEEDFVVSVPEGLPLQYICGIEPQGKYERDEIFKNDLKNTQLIY